MTATGVRVVGDSYVDSVLQLAGTRAMRAAPGVDWAAAAMGTPANVETLRGEGFADEALNEVGANDLVLAVRATDGDSVDAALQALSLIHI